jgi:LacI family transcriptional regulator, gluconate utilization system Gnt-I transcriptional repressor
MPAMIALSDASAISFTSLVVRQKHLSPAPQRVRLADIASQVGVGTMTVSRALNKPQLVSPDLRERILKTANQLGYVHNRVASGLASGGAPLIPVLIPTLHHSVYVPFLDGLCSVLPDAGYEILLSTTEYLGHREEALVKALLGWNPKGLILAGVDHSRNTRKLLQQSRVPVVEVMDLTPNPIDMNVGFSQYEVGRTVAGFLARLGRKRVAYAGMLTEIDFKSVRRITGFQEVLKDYALPHHLIQRTNEPSSIALGRKLLQDLLAAHPKVDAIFLGNDDLAAGAVFECRKQGIRVPDDIAIAGFNDQEIAAEMEPPLTSVFTPRFEIGRVSGEKFLRRFAGETDVSTSDDLGFKLVARASTGKELGARF